jgi:hypothetical protein
MSGRSDANVADYIDPCSAARNAAAGAAVLGRAGSGRIIPANVQCPPAELELRGAGIIYPLPTKRRSPIPMNAPLVYRTLPILSWDFLALKGSLQDRDPPLRLDLGQMEGGEDYIIVSVKRPGPIGHLEPVNSAHQSIGYEFHRIWPSTNLLPMNRNVLTCSNDLK